MRKRVPVKAPRARADGIAAVRGAITVPENTAAQIRSATARLLRALLEANRLTPERIVSAVFTATHDLDADFPAHAARLLGWGDVPLLGAQELPVPGALARVVRVLLTVRGVRPGQRLVPVYLEGAAALRPDLAKGGPAGASSSARPATAARPASRRRVALIGLGQIGGSIGLALGRSGDWWRLGVDRDRPTLEAALAAGAIDEACPSPEAACARVALAVVATPVDALPRLVARVARTLPRGAALLDTGSTRGATTAALAAAAKRGLRAVGGHPIAGSEGRGFGSARPDLFEGAPFVLLPEGRGVPPVVTALVRDLGARPLQVKAGAHDRALARTSHLPYLLACALHDLGAKAARRGLAGPTFRDMTRVAASDPRVAAAYCRANAREIAAAWRRLRAALDRRVLDLDRGR